MFRLRLFFFTNITKSAAGSELNFKIKDYFRFTFSEFPLMPTTPENKSIGITFALLGSRLVFFLLFQAIVALLVSSWHKSVQYWLLTATLTNLVSIALLLFIFRKEGKNYFSLFRINRSKFKADILIFLGIVIIIVPVVFAPGYFLSLLLWNDINTPTEMMFGAIEPLLLYVLLIAFPVTIAFAELATYFGYIMPKLKDQLKNKFFAVLLPVLFLSIQHCTLPFIPDLNFIIYRGLVFLPFAILIGISIFYRPSLFIYFAVLHGLMDFGTAIMFLLEKK